MTFCAEFFTSDHCMLDDSTSWVFHLACKINMISKCWSEVFWSQLTLSDLNSLVPRQRPTRDNVMQCLTAENEDHRADEHRAFYFLQQFILSLEMEDLQHFLHFVTGSVDGQTDRQNCDSLCTLSIYAVAQKRALPPTNGSTTTTVLPAPSSPGYVS